jgi:4-hydroxy-tetrahydrodipicolinate reductase
MKKIKAVQMGCGPIGCSVVKYASQRPDFKFVGAIDVDKNLVGRDLGEVAGVGKLRVRISDQVESVLSRKKPDVVFLTTTSSLEALYPQVKKCARAKVNVVSTCEELSYPYKKALKLAAKIDKIAKAKKITVLSTGVNPGFLMDAWPLFMTGVCQHVKRIKAVRVQNASPRRGPFQKKIGAGCTLEEFKKLKESGKIKHVGLPESAAMIADGLGWKIDKIVETIEPIIATTEIQTEFVTVKRGQAAGVRQVAKGTRSGEELITLEFEASVGAPESYDGVYITGIPNMEVVIKGGTHGDIATAAITVNSARRVIEAASGLLTMKDLPPVTFRS